VGWIGRHRMQAIGESGAGIVAAICDPSPQERDAAIAEVPQARVAGSIEELLAMDLDGLVIATPSAMHAEQSIAALDAGLAVFCQKPLGRTAAETAAVVDAAREADRLLGVDLSYRKVKPLELVKRRIADGAIGEIFAADLVFHNAWGPDKPWFYDLSQSGGGCVIDLGVHLVDALLWVLDFPQVTGVSSRLFRAGKPLAAGEVEDFAWATLDLSTGASARLACSWRLHAGQEARISVVLHGTGGSLAFENLDGSFYGFQARTMCGTQSSVIESEGEGWGGRQAVAWARRLGRGEGFNPVEGDRLVAVAKVLDAIYGR
jgi:predicted dehydrogenase